MTSKAYFAISIVFLVLYVITSFGAFAGLPGWIHQVCTVTLGVTAYLGYQQRKKEQNKE